MFSWVKLSWIQKNAFKNHWPLRNVKSMGRVGNKSQAGAVGETRPRGGSGRHNQEEKKWKNKITFFLCMHQTSNSLNRRHLCHRLLNRLSAQRCMKSCLSRTVREQREKNTNTEMSQRKQSKLFKLCVHFRFRAFKVWISDFKVLVFNSSN